MTREELNAEKKERAEARINSALQTFADMIIARMETIEASNWKKGWTDGEAMIGLPQNVTGRVYTGSNAFLCQLHTMKKNYKVPVYFTHKQIRDLGAHLKKGEKSIPIFKWGLSIYNRENGKKATLKEYDSLPKEERDEKYKVIPYLKIFKEWNIDQTNLEEVNKENYEYLEMEEMMGYVKYNWFHKEQHKPFKEDAFNQANFYYNRDDDYYVCPMGQHMEPCGQRQTKSDSGYVSVITLYRAQRCDGCPLGSLCKKSKGNRTIYVNHKLNAYKKEAFLLLTSEEGLKHRSQRPIEPEAVFGQMKADMHYKRFRHFGMDKVYMDLGLFGMGFNLKKYLGIKR